MIKELDGAVQKLSLCHCCHYGICHKHTGIASIKRELSERHREWKLEETQSKHKKETCASHTAGLRLNLLNLVEIFSVLLK